MSHDLILGTAGHIDHGKTALVRALTGTDTDRLPEEKQRGITIEPGFARLEVDGFQLGIVDVPGHERFIRQMLAGATGIDLVMLVVAATESVKPQTREHFEILRLLGVGVGVVVLTKCDLVDGAWMELVEEEIRELTRHSFLEGAPIVRTSAVSGEGMDRLLAALKTAAVQADSAQRRRRFELPFRMAIDRSFSLSGHGAIVTGSVVSGQAQVGQTLVVEPGGHEVRVRSLQNHDAAVSEVAAGQRAAINISGIDHHQIVRGQEIAEAGYLRPARLITARLNLLSSAPRALKDRTRVRVHLGTAELMANARLLDGAALEPGESAGVQLFLSEPAACVHGQPFVVRSESPMVTIGGGQVLDPCAERLRRLDAAATQAVAELASPRPEVRLAASVYLKPIGEWQAADAPRLASVASAAEGLDQALAAGTLRRLEISPSQSIVVHRQAIADVAERLQAMLNRLHDERPLQLAFSLPPLEQQFGYLRYRQVFAAALQQLVDQGAVVRREGTLAATGRGPRLSKNQRRQLEELIEQVRAAGIETPERKVLVSGAGKGREGMAELLELAVANGDLIPVSGDYYLHRDVLDAIRTRLSERMAGGEGMTVSQMRELLGTSRKYAVPLAEYLDRSGFTRRDGDLRFLTASARAPSDATGC